MYYGVSQVVEVDSALGITGSCFPWVHLLVNVAAAGWQPACTTARCGRFLHALSLCTITLARAVYKWAEMLPFCKLLGWPQLSTAAEFFSSSSVIVNCFLSGPLLQSLFSHARFLFFFKAPCVDYYFCRFEPLTEVSKRCHGQKRAQS